MGRFNDELGAAVAVIKRRLRQVPVTPVARGAQLRALAGGRRSLARMNRRRALKAIRAEARARLQQERWLNGLECLEGGLGVILEVLPTAAWLFLIGGGVLQNEAARGLTVPDLETAKTSNRFRVQLIAASTAALVTAVAAPADRGALKLQRSAEWGLTARQAQTLEMLLDGATNKEISHVFGCTLRTAEVHVRNVLRCAGVHSRSALIVHFWRVEVPTDARS